MGDLEGKRERERRVSKLEGERKPRDPTSRQKNLAWWAERRRSVRREASRLDLRRRADAMVVSKGTVSCKNKYLSNRKKKNKIRT